MVLCIFTYSKKLISKSRLRKAIDSAMLIIINVVWSDTAELLEYLKDNNLQISHKLFLKLEKFCEISKKLRYLAKCGALEIRNLCTNIKPLLLRIERSKL